METHFSTEKAYIDSYEFDEDANVFVFQVTTFFVGYIETHELPEELAWELLTKYLDDADLLNIGENAIEQRDLNELIDLGFVNTCIVQRMYVDNFTTTCASWEEFLEFPDKMKRQHFFDCIMTIPAEKRWVWHYMIQRYVYDGEQIPDIYPEELRQIAVDLKKQFNPGKADFIDAYHHDGILSFCREEDKEYRNIFLSEEQIILSLGYTIDRDRIYDNSGQCVAKTTDGLEFTYRELCEVARKYI